jgi:hypothetical protein
MGLSAKSLMTALIVSAVAATMMDIEKANALRVEAGIKSERVTRSEDLPTEPRYALWCIGEGIKISNPSPKIEKFSVVLDVQNVLGANSCLWHMWRGSAGAYHLGSQHPGARWSSGINISKIEIRLHPSIAERAIAIKLHLAGVSIAAVLPNWRDSPVESSLNKRVRFVEWAYAARENKSPLVGNKGFFGDLGLSTGGQPQRASEGSDYDSGERANRTFVSLYEAASTPNVAISGDTEGGWIFFGGIGAFIIFMCGYAFLECWRENAFHTYKRRNKDDKRRE